MIRKRKIGETQEPIMTQGIGFSNSVSSVMSIKELKDINNEKWNLTNKKSETFNRKEGTLEKVSFYYNLFLIILAIILCIFIKHISKIFVKQRVNYEEIRQMHFEFLKATFLSINAVAIEGDIETAQTLNKEYNDSFISSFKMLYILGP
jgi:H+/gluconate symporter-like permease